MANYPDRLLTGKTPGTTYLNLVELRGSILTDGSGNSIDMLNLTSSFALNGGGTTINTGSTYPITASRALSSISSSYAKTASFALNIGGGTTLITGSTYPITSSWAISASWAPSSLSTLSSSYVSGAVVATNFVGGVTNIIFSPTTSINFDAAYFHTSSLSGSTYLTCSNLGAGKIATVKLNASGSDVTLTYPISWSWAGTAPTTITNGTTLVATLISYGTTDGNIVGMYTPQAAVSAVTASYVTGSRSVIGNLTASVINNLGGAEIGGYTSNVPSQTTTRVGFGAGGPRSNDNAVSVCIGYQAAYGAAVNEGSVQVGYQAGLASNASALNCVQIGYQAGMNSATCPTSVQVGFQAGMGSTNATDAVQIGNLAGNSSTTATRAVQIGSNAGATLATNCNEATQVGYSAGSSATTSTFATQIGAYAVYSCAQCNEVTAVGHRAGYTSTNAQQAVLIGADVGYNATRAAQAVLIGYQAGYIATNITNSVMVGYKAGYNAAIGENTICIGALADAVNNGTNVTKSIAIGYNAKVTGNNQCVIGGTGVDAVTVQVTSLIGVVENLAPTSTQSINFNSAMFHTASLTGPTYITASNLGSGKMTSFKMTATGSANCNLYYPSQWVWLGSTSSYSAVSASKTAVISLTCFGTTDVDICATYVTQQ